MRNSKIKFRSEEAVLLAEKGIWLSGLKTLVIADVHWGKIDHFRKAGIPVPVKGNDKNIEVLVSLMNRYKPNRLIFLGDLFHSHYNEEWETLGQVTKAFTQCSFELIIGNHDILSKRQYERHNIVVHPQSMQQDDLLFTHEPLEKITKGLFNLAGHIHPGAHLIGSGKQSVTLPCFFVRENQCILPAFGSFTGLARVKPKTGEKVFVIADEKVIAMNER